jgi:tRNA(Ile)-lysidine synthase
VQSLSKQIEATFAQIPKQAQVFIAYSGGVDSHVLLHLCAVYRHDFRLHAVYIHHGLQDVAEGWGQHCQATAEQLQIGFSLLRVNAHPAPGQSPEEAARNARYQALQALLNNGDVLMLAQHREDQLETVLLQLFRGAGLPGLSGMPAQCQFGKGQMVRPLLDASKQAILDYAQAQNLHWVEDPTNQQNDYDRNYLRNVILPNLKERWPASDKTVSRSAQHCAEAQSILTELAQELLNQVLLTEHNTLDINKLLSFTQQKQHLIVRQWFKYLGLKMPPQSLLSRIFTEVIAAKTQSDPVLALAEHSVRRYHGQLYCVPNFAVFDMSDKLWPRDQRVVTISKQMSITAYEASTGILAKQWQNALVTVRFRSGGETIKLPGRQGHHALKKLYQEAGIPPWQRTAMPLIYLDDKLAAVADLWISADFYTDQTTTSCVRLVVDGIR